MNTNITHFLSRKFRTIFVLALSMLVSANAWSKDILNNKTSVNTVDAVAAPGTALDFDGTNDYIAVNPTFPSFSNFTFSAWVNLRTYTNSKFFSTASYELGTKNGQIIFWVDPWGDELTGELRFKTNEWAHIAVTSDGSTIKFYVNGNLDKTFSKAVQIPSVSESTSPQDTHPAMTIGKHVRVTNNVDGKLDELKFESVARTQEEIRASMFNVVPANTAGLVAYYRFDEGAPAGNNASVETLNDLTGNNHNGILNNFSLEGAASNFVESYAMVVPTAVPASSVNGAGFTANWTAPSVGTVGNYLLDVSTNANFSSFVTGYEALNVNLVTSYNVAGLQANTAYYYRVRANKAAAGLGAASNAIQVSTTSTGVSDVENIAFTVCPNPSKGQFNVVSDKVVKAIEVLNIAGKLVFKTTAVSDNTSIDLSNQAKGVYFVRVSFDDSVKTQRVCIE